MNTKYLVAACVIALAVSGCATKRYGRLEPLVPAEAESLDCKQIGIEMAKVVGFKQDVKAGAKIDWRSVAGFLGDFGTGNSMEKSDALHSADKRMTQLAALRVQKGCPLSTLPDER